VPQGEDEVYELEIIFNFFVLRECEGRWIREWRFSSAGISNSFRVRCSDVPAFASAFEMLA
jgi:hypothetical protein